jgi:hypothetical protein
MGQMLAFYCLYNCYFPYNLLRYLHYFFQYMINWHKEIFEDRAWNNHKSSASFRNNWLNHENRRYYEETVYNHFTIQFGVILLLQLIFLFIFLIVKLLYWMNVKKVTAQNIQALSLD